MTDTQTTTRVDATPAPTEEPQKPHLSASQIETWLLCARRWAYGKVLKIRKPSGGAATQGKAFHSALEWAYNLIKAGQKMPTITELQERFVWELDKLLNEGLELPENEKEAVRLSHYESRDGLINQGLGLVESYRLEIMPRVGTPLHIEREFRVSLGDHFPFDLLGYIDLIAENEEGVWVRDHKLRSKSRGFPKQPDLDHNIQVTMYSLMYRAEFMQIEDGLALDCVVKTDPPKAKQCGTWRAQKDLIWLLELITGMARAIWSETYPPCLPTTEVDDGGRVKQFLCSPRWCDFHDLCMGDKPRWPVGGERHPGLPPIQEER